MSSKLEYSSNRSKLNAVWAIRSLSKQYLNVSEASLLKIQYWLLFLFLYHKAISELRGWRRFITLGRVLYLNLCWYSYQDRNSGHPLSANWVNARHKRTDAAPPKTWSEISTRGQSTQAKKIKKTFDSMVSCPCCIYPDNRSSKASVDNSQTVSTGKDKSGSLN